MILTESAWSSLYILEPVETDTRTMNQPSILKQELFLALHETLALFIWRFGHSLADIHQPCDAVHCACKYKAENLSGHLCCKIMASRPKKDANVSQSLSDLLFYAVSASNLVHVTHRRDAHLMPSSCSAPTRNSSTD